MNRRLVYSITAATMAVIIVSVYYIFFLKSIDNLTALYWIGYGGLMTSIVSYFLCPTRHKQKKTRMILNGLLIPTIVILILALTYSAQNPGFPDCMDCDIKPTIISTLDGGLVMFLVFSFTTLGAPYITGILISLLFIKCWDI